MSTSEINVVNRIRQLCVIRNITINTLANLGGLPPSTLYSILSYKSENTNIETIRRICAALHMSVYDFYNVEAFKHKEY